MARRDGNSAGGKMKNRAVSNKMKKKERGKGKRRKGVIFC